MDSHDGRIHQSSHTRKPHDLPLPLLTTSPKVKGYILGSCLYHSRGTLLVYVKMQLFHYNCGKRFSSFLRFPQVVSFHCFEKPTVLHLIQLQSSDQVIRVFHCLFIILKIPLFSMPFNHDSVIRMFHCLFIVLKIPLFSMPFNHESVIRMFHCLFIILKIPLFSMPFNHDSVIRMIHCLSTVCHAIQSLDGN